MDNRLASAGFLRLPQIIGDPKTGIPPLIPVSKSTWWSGVKSGRFPKPIKLGTGRVTVWSAAEISDFIATLSAAA